MVNPILNKKKLKLRVYLIISSVLLFIILILFLFYQFFIKRDSLKYLNENIEQFSFNYNFVLEEIEINELKYISPDEINKYFDTYYKKSIFLIPMNEILNKIKLNGWVKKVSLKSNYKNKIFINIIEVTPIAVFLEKNHYFLIDKNGKIIDNIEKENIQSFIVFTGENSKDNIINMYMKIPNSLKSLIKKASYVNGRRWDILLRNNILIKLPEIKIEEAFMYFEEIYQNISKSEESNIDYFDLRIKNKAVIKFVD